VAINASVVRHFVLIYRKIKDWGCSRMIRVLTWFRRVLAVEFGLCCALRRGRRFRENQIMSARCTTRSDFAVKLTIYDFHGRDGVDAESIIEDFRRAIEVPASAPPFDFTV
jgi:hypothetical protein